MCIRDSLRHRASRVLRAGKPRGQCVQGRDEAQIKMIDADRDYLLTCERRRLHMLSAYWGFVFMSLHQRHHYSWTVHASATGKAAPPQPNANRRRPREKARPVSFAECAERALRLWKNRLWFLQMVSSLTREGDLHVKDQPDFSWASEFNFPMMSKN